MEFPKGFVVFKKNKLVFVVILFLLLNIPLTMYLVTSKRFSVLGWFNQGWLYRREIVLSGSGSNVDVLVPIDTATLISQGKMRSDCGDIRFVDSNDITALQYWIEDGCNTTNTQIWIRVPTSTSGKRIYMYYGNSGATSTQMSWGGNVYMYSDTVCPEGWTRASEMDNRFLYGSNTFGQTGGSETHTHGNASCTSGVASNTTGVYSNTGATTVTSSGHTHTLNTGFTASNHLPPYRDMVLCYSRSFTVKQGLISPMRNFTTTDYTQFGALHNFFPRVASSYGATGGSEAHTHTGVAMTSSTPSVTQGTTNIQQATGGTITSIGNDRVHTFTSSGTFTTSIPLTIRVLVVGGGGCGGATNGGGGGAGGISYSDGTNISSGSYPVTVGNGGNASTSPAYYGEKSSFSNLFIGYGGGRGANNGDSGGPGGSGGGGAGDNDRPGGSATKGFGGTVYGNDGGSRVGHDGTWSGAGGGGACAVGGNTTSTYASGDGGNGCAFDISGTNTYYGGGGGGGSEFDRGAPGLGGGGQGGAGAGVAGYAAVPNTGGGGGGGSGLGGSGGVGGSGIVIVRYALPASISVASPTHTHQTIANSISTASNIPKYVGLAFGKANTDTYVTAFNLLITSERPPLGYSDPGIYDSFLRGGSSFSVGGSNTHSHNVNIIANPTTTQTTVSSGSVPVSSPNHTHSCSTVSAVADNIPPYYSVIYAQRKTSMSVTVGSETTQNNNPNEPTSLQTNSQTNPQNITNLQPTFSAIFSDPDSTEKSSHYQIQLNTTTDFTGTVLWDTGKTAFTEPVNNGDRTPQIQYNGSPLSFGTRYYWRIKLWDNNPTVQGESPWSQTAEFTTIGIPSTPTPSEPTATSTASIRWNFTYTTGIPSGVKILDEDDNVVKTCLGESITSCEETGLSENTQYKRKIVAFNNVGDSSPSSLISRYTLISVPNINLVSKTVDSIKISTETLLPNSQIYFDCIEDNECDNGLNTWNTTTEATSSSLNYNTKYSYQVKARNGDNIETTYSSPLSVYTLSPIPAVESLEITKNSITLKQTLTNNLTEGESGMFFEVENNYNNFEGINIWLKTPALVKPLHASTTYKFRAKSRNYDAIESAFSTYVQMTTLPNTPEIVSSSIEKTSTSISFDITKESLGAYSLQSYSVYEEITGKYLNIGTLVLQDTQTWSEYINGVSTPKIKINSLSPSTEYRFSVISRNFFGTVSANTTPFTIFTKISTPTGFTTNNVKHNEATYSVDSVGTAPVETYKIFDENDELKLTCTKAQMISSECKETNLTENTMYRRKIQAFNSNTESDITDLHIFKTRYEYPKITELRSSGSNHLQITLVGDISESIQIYEVNEGKYYDLATQTLTSTQTSFNLINNIVVKELSPNHKYSFKTKGILGIWSPISETYTLANTPVILKIEEIDSNTIKIYLGNSENPPHTEFAIKEGNLNKYLDFSNGNLVDEAVYGTYADFGGANGVILKNLLIGRQYAFSAIARNSSKNLTSWSPTMYVGLKAILLNVSNDISVNLLSTPNISPITREYGQYGKHVLRITSKNYLLGDVPILFSKDRDWKNAIFANSPSENKAVIKISSNEGLDGRFTMYVPTNNADSFLICPNATTLSEISTDCSGVVKYTGQFPQAKEVEQYAVTVSKAILEGIEYWVVDGLNSTGGMGYTEEKEEPKASTKEPIKTVVVTEEKEEHTQGSFVEDILTKISNLDEKTKQGIMTSTAVTTTAVSSFFIFTNLSQLFYSLTHILNVLLALLGFKKKQRPYGYVYDSRTKEPVNMAIVRIFNSEGKLVTTSVTDSKGRFTGNIEEGIYTLTVSKHSYIFPSSIITGIIDPPTYNIYQNNFKIGEKQEIEIAVPIDSVENTKDSKLLKKGLLRKILLWLNVLLLAGGMLFSVYMCVTYPTFLNYFISSLYLIPLSTILFVIAKNEIKYGTVTDSQGRKVAGISILLKEMEFGRIVQRRVTNEKGEYRFILDKGTYQLIIGDKGESNIFTIQKDNSIIARDINIQ